jgi:hypothetical protein
MQQAYIGCHGSAIRWLYQESEWPDASAIVNAMLGKSQLRVTVETVNAILEDNAHLLKCKSIDYERPDIWPTQSVLSKMLHHVTATELEQRLIHTDPQLASWYASKRLPLANSSLRTIPAFHVYKVSPSLFRIQMANSILAPVPGLKHSGVQCVCGYAGRDMRNGVHFFSRCNHVTMNTTRHNATVEVFGKMIEAVGWEKKDVSLQHK